uniref:Uncharacterized protein n=1 Tax=Arundo donax TaxID=35708 RepID=A0A0A9FZH8_ARUDO
MFSMCKALQMKHPQRTFQNFTLIFRITLSYIYHHTLITNDSSSTNAALQNQPIPSSRLTSA